MKSLKKLLFLFIAISTQLFAQNYGLGNTDPSVFSKFRLPDTKLHLFSAGSDFSFSSVKQIYSNEDYNSDGYMYNSNISISPKYYYLNQSEDRILSLNLSSTGNYQNNFNKRKDSYSIEESLDKQWSYDLRTYISGNYKNYFNSSDCFYSLTTTLNLQMIQSNSNVNPMEIQKWQDYGFYFGIGWGKLRNVTSVVSAIRLQERLKVLNIINNDLNQNTIEKLSQHFSNTNNIWQVFDRGDKNFWPGIEEILQKDGVSIKGLNMYGNAYLKEINNELRFERYEGYNFGVYLQIAYSNYFFNQPYYANSINESTFICGNIYFNYSHQMNLNSQLSGNFSLAGGPNLTKDGITKQKYELLAGVKYDYELSDRLVTSLAYNLSLYFRNESNQNRDLLNTLRISAQYFVEDQVSLNLSYQLNCVENRNLINMINSRSNQ